MMLAKASLGLRQRVEHGRPAGKSHTSAQVLIIAE